MNKQERAEAVAAIEWLYDHIDDVTTLTVTFHAAPWGAVERVWPPPPKPKRPAPRYDWYWCDGCDIPATNGTGLAKHQAATGHTGRTSAPGRRTPKQPLQKGA